jgi:hypothetical protein
VDLIVRKERPFSREEFARRERRDLGGLVEKWAATLGVLDLWQELVATARGSGRP